MLIEQIGEHGLIQRIQSKFPSKYPGVVLGIGDDAAIITPDARKSLLLSTDTLREDIHFRKGYCTFYDMGWKAVAVSISDIAAMGGMPRHLLLSIAVPHKTSVTDLDGMIKGVADITTKYEVSLIGGNISRSTNGVTIDTTVIGELNKGTGVARSGASVGDMIYITGKVGKSAIGFSLLKSATDIRSISYRTAVPFIASHLRPVPRVREGMILGANKLATAMIDISDGLLADLDHICKQSKVGANIYTSLIPLPDIPRRLKREVARDPLYYALYGGEDYELLFTVKKGDKGKLEAVCKQERLEVTPIGEIAPMKRGINIVGERGTESIGHMGGYDHFKTHRGTRCLKRYQ